MELGGSKDKKERGGGIREKVRKGKERSKRRKEDMGRGWWGAEKERVGVAEEMIIEERRGIGEERREQGN